MKSPHKLKFSAHVDVMVQNSGCFAFEHYVMGLKTLIRELARSGKVGAVELAPISSTYFNTRPAAFILGETNRVFSRYQSVSTLLRSTVSTSKEKMATEYAHELMRPFQTESFISRYRARKNVLAKIDRIKALDRWVKEHGTEMAGVDSYIRGLPYAESLNDYPLALRLTESRNIDDYIQLDGSHRRCVALCNGQKEITTLVISLSQIISYIEKNKPPYFYQFLSTFVSLVSHIDDDIQI